MEQGTQLRELCNRINPIDVAKIFIVFHSEHGNTAMVANIVATQLRNRGAYVKTFPVEEVSGKLEKLMEADTILFGTPTRFGNVSAPFKQFMENTGRFWYKQPWRNKLAAGFTVSSTTNGDKLNTLIALALFAAQHGMIWIPLGVLPRF
ncbi:MAG: flavodoxin family protein, partial [Sphingobacteriales bacterium]